MKAKEMGKAKRDHFSLVEALVGQAAVPYQYFKEDGGNYRLVAYVNYPHTTMMTAVPEIFGTAYTLADNWRLFGLGSLRTGQYQHVAGLWSAAKPSPKAPQLVSMMFEVDRGLAMSMNKDGGVFIEDARFEESCKVDASSPLQTRPPAAATS